MEQAASYTASEPQPTLSQVAQRNLSQTDPRLPIIAEGLRIRGKTLEEFKGRLEDPAYVNKLFTATMQHAESIDKTLTMARGSDAYMQVLKTAPGMNDAPPKAPAPIMGAGFTAIMDGLSGDREETAKQMTAGAATDIAVGLVSSAEDMGRVQKKFGGLVERLTGLKSDAAQIAVSPGGYLVSKLIDRIRDRAGTDPSKALTAWAEENIVSKPDNVVDGLTRGVAGFLVPYLKMKTLFATGKTAGRIAQAGASAAVTAFQNPNDPLASEAIENLARGLDPQNPGVIRSWITRYITNELPEDELWKNLANRGLRAGEDTLLGVAAEGVIAGIKGLKNGWKRSKIAPSAVTPPALSKDAAMEAEFTPVEPPKETEFAPVLPQEKGKGFEFVSANEAENVVSPGPRSQLIMDLDIREEIQNIEASQKSIPSTFATDSLHTEQGQAVLEKLNANPENIVYQKTAQDWLQSTRETTSATVSSMRSEVASRLSEAPETPISDRVSPVKIAANVADVQEKILDEIFSDPDAGAQNLSQNRNTIVADLTHAGMKPQEAQKFINETLQLFDPPMVQDIRIAHETVDNPPKGQTGRLLQSLKDQGLDNIGMKTVILAAARGAAAAIAASELILPGESEAGDGEPSKSEKVLAAAILAALGGTIALKQALKIGKGLKKVVEATDGPVSNTASTSAARRPVQRVKSDINPARVEGLHTLTEEQLKDPNALFEHTNPRFDLTADIKDLDELETSVSNLFHDVPDMMRLKFLNTPINSANEWAELTGQDPKALQALIDRSTTPLIYSDDGKKLLYLSLKGHKQLTDLAVMARGLPNSQRTPELAAEILKLHDIYGHLATGMAMAKSDFARSLNLFKHAADGRLLSVKPEGMNAGDLIAHPENFDRYLNQLLKTLEEPGATGAMARKMAKPTLSGAISQAFIHALLGAVQTVSNTAWSAGYRIALNPFIRLGGAVAQKYGPDILTGAYKAGESPEVEEFGAMAASIAKNFAEGVQVAKKTLLTGKTTFLEQGASIAATGHQNAFVREAFGPVPKMMDQAGALVGLPNAGNFFNYLGSFLEVVGTRGLLTVDEFTQFMVEKMELDAHAIRASKNPALNFSSAAEQQAWMDRFKADPPKKVLDEIQYQKAASSYMNKLFDDRSAGSPVMAEMRRLAGHFENSIKHFPATRVLFPFVRTAMNVGQFTAEITPGFNIGVMWTDLKSPNSWVRGEAQGRVIASMGLATTFALMGANGSIRGTLTADPAYRRELETAGTPENSIDWGGRTWKINTREPIGFLMAAFGQLGASMSGESVADEEMGAVEALWSSLYTMLQDHHFAGAIAELVQDMNPRELDQKVKRLGAAGATMDTIDDLLLRPIIPPRQWQELVSTTDATKKVYDTYWEKIKARAWPEGGVTETDILRRPRWAGSGLSDESVNNAIKIVSGVNQDRITQDALSVKLIAKSIHIPDPNPVFTLQGITVPLTKAEQQELRWTTGHPPGAAMSLYAALSQLVNDPRWEGLSNAQAELVIDDMVERYVKAARRHLLARSESIQQRLRDMKAQKGL